jgi:hypothetical protein
MLGQCGACVRRTRSGVRSRAGPGRRLGRPGACAGTCGSVLDGQSRRTRAQTRPEGDLNRKVISMVAGIIAVRTASLTPLVAGRQRLRVAGSVRGYATAPSNHLPAAVSPRPVPLGRTRSPRGGPSLPPGSAGNPGACGLTDDPLYLAPRILRRRHDRLTKGNGRRRTGHHYGRDLPGTRDRRTARTFTVWRTEFLARFDHPYARNAPIENAT